MYFLLTGTRCCKVSNVNQAKTDLIKFLRLLYCLSHLTAYNRKGDFLRLFFPQNCLVPASSPTATNCCSFCAPSQDANEAVPESLDTAKRRTFIAYLMVYTCGCNNVPWKIWKMLLPCSQVPLPVCVRWHWATWWMAHLKVGHELPPATRPPRPGDSNPGRSCPVQLVAVTSAGPEAPQSWDQNSRLFRFESPAKLNSSSSSQSWSNKRGSPSRYFSHLWS